MKISSWAKNLSLISQLGVTMITPILICTFIGIFVDEKIGTSPIFTLIFILLGVGAAFRNLFYYTSKQIKKEDKHE